MELKTVECPQCGNEQEDEIDNESHICICEECGAIFFSEEKE